MVDSQGWYKNQGQCWFDDNMIDTHCHLDQLDSPERVIRECENHNLTVVAVTNLPSHYAMALPHVAGAKHIKLALGMHPLMVKSNQAEMSAFFRLVDTVRFIGEIGLDYSKQGLATKPDQLACFDRICAALKPRKQFVTVHSRGAVSDVLATLQKYSMAPVVFHWFTGTRTQLTAVLSAGHYVSINPAMLSSETGRMVIDEAPPHRVLTETDAPFARTDNRPTRPTDVRTVVEHLAKSWGISQMDAEIRIEANFATLSEA